MHGGTERRRDFLYYIFRRDQRDNLMPEEAVWRIRSAVIPPGKAERRAGEKLPGGP